MFENLRERWGQLSRFSRAGLVAGVCAVLALLVGGSIWLMQDNYETLFSDLNGQDAAAMVAELDRMKVPYRLADGGGTIQVEREAVYKTRLKLMGKGLDLHGAVGFEIFNNADFGMTEFAQKINYQRALQGELARTIMGLDEVKLARVHLVLPESGLLKRQASKPKASISLVMKGNSALNAEQISGIQRLVAASVPEIAPSSVTVVDHRGVAISKDGGDDVALGANGRLDSKRQIEDYLTRKVLAVMDRAVGPGRAIVSVDVSLNYDQVKVTTEDVVPLPNTSGQQVGAVVRRRENFQGGDAVTSALGSAFGAAGQAPANNGSSEVEYVNGRRVEQVNSTPGGVRRLSVGVMVPDITDPAELAKLREMVSMAVGVQGGRGDSIVVYNLASVPAKEPGPDAAKGDKAGVQEAADAAARAERTKGGQPMALFAILGAGALLVALLLFVLLRGRSVNQDKGRGRAALTETERENLRQEIQRWASAEKAS